MNKICAWCNKELGPTGAFNQDEHAPISHGICYSCAAELLLLKPKSLSKFLDQFPKPVFVINAAAEIVTANSMGFSLLGKKPEEAEGKLGGDAFGCRKADLPGGCGKTIHCKSCAIRQTVSDTMLSGKNHRMVPAYPDLYWISAETQIRFLISTEKAGAAVLLQIDDVAEMNLPKDLKT